MTSLEFGSLFLGLVSQDPTSAALHRACQVGMTVSNVASAALGVWYSVSYPDVGAVERVVFPVVGIGLCLARQLVEVGRWRDVAARRKAD